MSRSHVVSFKFGGKSKCYQRTAEETPAAKCDLITAAESRNKTLVVIIHLCSCSLFFDNNKCVDYWLRKNALVLVSVWNECHSYFYVTFSSSFYHMSFIFMFFCYTSFFSPGISLGLGDDNQQFAPALYYMRECNGRQYKGYTYDLISINFFRSFLEFWSMFAD